MKNVTVALPEETARWVRVWAAEQGKSVSAALADLIAEQRHDREKRERALDQFRSVPQVMLGPDEKMTRGIREATLVVSAQVLNEFYVNATQKLTPGMNREDARTVCRSLSAVSCEPVRNETIAAAWDVHDRFALSWWDSLIVASALLAGCTRLKTEDLQNGLVIDGMRILDPFA